MSGLCAEMGVSSRYEKQAARLERYLGTGQASGAEGGPEEGEGEGGVDVGGREPLTGVRTPQSHEGKAAPVAFGMPVAGVPLDVLAVSDELLCEAVDRSGDVHSSVARLPQHSIQVGVCGGGDASLMTKLMPDRFV